VEEIEAVGRNELHAVTSHLRLALLHDLNAEAWPMSRAYVRRQYPGGLARWEVRPFSDGRKPSVMRGEDRYAGLQNNKRDGRNDLLDRSTDHPAPSPPIGMTAAARAPPD
jgi:hypothetical protein